MQTHEIDRLAEEIYIRRITEEKMVMTQPNATHHAEQCALDAYVLAEVFLATQTARTSKTLTRG